jgi:hypothetical protein
MQYYKFDKNGYYIEPVIADYGNVTNPMPDDVTEVRPPDGLYRAKWTGTEWVETSPMPEHDPETEQAVWDSENKTWSIIPKPEKEIAGIKGEKGDTGAAGADGKDAVLKIKAMNDFAASELPNGAWGGVY